jgi:hypothetical protein
LIFGGDFYFSLISGGGRLSFRAVAAVAAVAAVL